MSADSTGSSRFPITGSVPFVRLMEVVSKYVSVRTSLTLLNKSLVELGHSPESMLMSDLPEVIETMMPGLRAFCAETQLNDLVLDLSSLSSLSSGAAAAAANARTSSGVTRRPLSVPPPAPGTTGSRSGHPSTTPTLYPTAYTTSASGTTPGTGSSPPAGVPRSSPSASRPHPGAVAPSSSQPISGHTALGPTVTPRPGSGSGIAPSPSRLGHAGPADRTHEADDEPGALSSPRRR